MPRRFGIDWDSYLSVFHAERPGVAEDVLSRASNGYYSPHRWLARAVSARAEVVLDIACGSGAMSRELARPGRTVVGVDISAAELALAQSRSAGPWVRGDALRLPIADESVDAVTSSMGMVVVQPTEQLLMESARVLKPGGMLAFMAPTVLPLLPRDLRTGLQIAQRLRSLPRFPGPLELTGFAATLRRYGLRKIEDGRELYRVTIRSRADADLMVSALYLPATSWRRTADAISFLAGEVLQHGQVELAMPMRRVVALK
ncbi:MAG: class I SAM-dependent methyltransferase [Actinomycetia bacterium]|nr:class I SAM-dependent methyltransferase [Actinomycetes bacterium]